VVSDIAARRAEMIRDALEIVGDELIELGPNKSGSVTIHFQNGLPRKAEWKTNAELIARSAAKG
jgi:hypothetical protein